MEEEKKQVKSEEKKELTIEELKKKLQECQKLKDEYLAGWQRARADLLNYKKTEMEKIGELIKYADVGLILKILPILDNFELAETEVRSMKYEETKYKEIINGFLQIKAQLQDFLKNQGVEEIKSIGEKFDPNFHEIAEEIEKKDKETGIIVGEIQKGYKIHGKVLRPVRVRVTK